MYIVHTLKQTNPKQTTMKTELIKCDMNEIIIFVQTQNDLKVNVTETKNGYYFTIKNQQNNENR